MCLVYSCPQAATVLAVGMECGRPLLLNRSRYSLPIGLQEPKVQQWSQPKNFHSHFRSHACVDAKSSQWMSRVPKIIWLYWSQGWLNAPWIVRCVLASWRSMNPNWRVTLLSEDNVHRYVRLPPAAAHWPPPARSDALRLALLTAYGGVWADATMLCTQPLNSWVDDAVVAEGFWMYHNGASRSPASWFLVGTNGSLLLR